MTDTITRLEQLRAAQVDHDQLYAHFRRLLTVVGYAIDGADRNSADLHKHLEAVREAHHAGMDLLCPPPAPDAPEGAEVRFIYAVRPRDRVYPNSDHGWVTVAHTDSDAPNLTKTTVRLTFNDDTFLDFPARDLIGIIPAPPAATADTPQEPA